MISTLSDIGNKSFLSINSKLEADIPRRDSWDQQNVMTTLKSSKNIKHYSVIISGIQKILFESKNSHKEKKL